MARKKKEDLPVFTVVEMPRWKNKLLDVITSMLFPGQKYFVITVNETGFITKGDGKYTDKKTGLTVDVSN